MVPARIAGGCGAPKQHNQPMHTGTVVALLLALASTTLVSLAYLREHGAVSELPALSLRRPVRAVGLLLGSRDWLAGFAMEAAGFGLYVAALALAPLALVQGVAAGGVGILAIASARIRRRRLRGREVLGAAVAVAGLALLGVSLTQGGDRGGTGSLLATALWLGGTAAVAVLVLTAGAALLGRGVAAGIAGGLFFAAGDICTKLTTEGGAHALFAIPLIAGYLLGTSLLQVGYQRAEALTVAGIATLITNALPIAAGTLLLHEGVPSGALGAARLLAFAAVTAGAILLARPKAGARRDAQASVPDAARSSLTVKASPRR
jgi:drug/metabolite transporter (DMT)-like permease